MALCRRERVLPPAPLAAPLRKVGLMPRQFLKDARGATAIEYGLIAALIAIVIVAAWPLLAGGIAVLFASITFPTG